MQHTVADNEHVKLVAHETAKRILGRAYDRLAANIEAGVDERRAAGQRLELARQFMKARIGVAMYSPLPGGER